MVEGERAGGEMAETCAAWRGNRSQEWGVGKQMDAHVRDEGQDALRAMLQTNTKERTRADAEEDTSVVVL